jgi:hypothetical protein
VSRIIAPVSIDDIRTRVAGVPRVGTAARDADVYPWQSPLPPTHVGVGVAVGAGGTGVRVGVAVAPGGAVGVLVGVRVGVEVGTGAPPQAVIALQTLSRPPDTVIAANDGSGSTPLKIALLSWPTLRPPWPGADRISAAAPVTCGVAIEVPLK